MNIFKSFLSSKVTVKVTAPPEKPETKPYGIEEKISEEQLMEKIKGRMPANLLESYLASKKLWVPLLVSLLLVIGLPIGVFLTRQPAIYQPSAAARASLSLPAALTTTVGQQTTVPVTLNTYTASVSRVDVKVRFDQSQLALVKVIPVVNNSTLTAFTPAKTSCDGNLCTIEFSVTTPEKSYYGVTVIASLIFNPIQPGTTNIAFVFAQGQTTGSNIFSDANPPVDILTRTNNLILTVNP
jgi:hypothetical protein